MKGKGKFRDGLLSLGAIFALTAILAAEPGTLWASQPEENNPVTEGSLKGEFEVSDTRKDTGEFCDNIPISFENVNVTEMQEAVYGDENYKICIDKEDFAEKAELPEEDKEKVSYVFTVKEGASREILEVGENGEVHFKKASDTPAVITVTREKIGNHSAASADYKIHVKQKEITVNPAYKGLRFEKIYDKADNRVFQKNATGDKLTGVKEIPLPGREGEDEIFVSALEGILPEGFQNVCVDSEGNVVPYEKPAEVKLTSVILGGKDAGNYKVNLEQNPVYLETKVTIQKRKIRLHISDGEREYGHWNEVRYFSDKVTDWTEEDYAKAGFQDADSEIEGLVDEEDRKNVIFPEPKEVEIPKEDTPDYELGLQKEKLTVYPVKETGEVNGDATDNYTFDLSEEGIRKGNLTINKEKLDRGDLDFLEDSGNAYISSDGKIWADSYNQKFHMNVNQKATNRYDSVYVEEGKAAIRVDTQDKENGYDFSGRNYADGEEKHLKVYLKNSSKKSVESERLEVTIHMDKAAPVLSQITTGGGYAVSEALDPLPFGKFQNKLTAHTETAAVSDEAGSGVAEWFSNVMEGESDADFTGRKIQEYMDPARDSCKWELRGKRAKGEDNAPLKGDIEMQHKEGKYVVLIKVKDNLGHTKVYASNGVLVDYKEPKISIDLAKGQYRAVSGIYGENVKLSIHAEDAALGAHASASAIKKAEIVIKSNGRETHRETLFDIKADQKTSWKLKELAEYCFQDFSYEVSAEENNSNQVGVFVIVTDNAGNERQAAYPLKFDVTAPVIETKYSSAARAQNEMYYSQPVKAEVIYTERNFSSDKEHLWFLVQTKGQREEAYSLSELESQLGVKAVWEDLGEEIQQNKRDAAAFTDNRKHKLVLTFDRDNHYVFTPYLKDLSECAGKCNHTGSNGEGREFVVDRTVPVIKVEYQLENGSCVSVPSDERERIYEKGTIRAWVTIDEQNFALQGRDVAIDVTVDAVQTEADPETGKAKAVPDYRARQKKNNNAVWQQQNADSYKSAYDFSVDANYTHKITYTDLAGNSVSYGPGYFTVDKTSPKGTVEIKDRGFWEHMPEKITFGLFCPSAAEVEIRGADHTSPVDSVQYTRVSEPMNREELGKHKKWLSASEDRPDFAGFTVSSDEQFIVYAKITDAAGNCEFFSSDGMIVDSIRPALNVTVMNLSQAQNGIFNEDVLLRIEAEDPAAGDTYSGLEKVWYTVSAAGNVNTDKTVELLNNSKDRRQSHKTFSQVITIPADVYNSNDVKVRVFATDFSGNQGESAITELKMDVTSPVISVVWNLGNPSNEKYYRDTRTATVTVTDRNFDEKNVEFHITNTDGKEAKIGSWNGDGNRGISDCSVNTCRVSFSADGDYTFTLTYTDLAGNRGEYEKTDTFTIDRTPPVLTVSYDNNHARNGSYFKEPRTAIVTVCEHNFHGADVRTEITAALQGRGISAPAISHFSSRGDVHTAMVRYEAEGDYIFDVECTDMAGNRAADYKPDTFTVDFTRPEVEIVNIKDKSANHDVVAPGVKVSDVNYDARKVSITVTGVHNGKVDIEKTIRPVENGQKIQMKDFAREEKADDLYKLTAKSVDKAGNETEKSVTFSVNRYGSVYVLDNATRKDRGGWLGTKDYTYIRKEQPLGVMEYNVDAIASCKITVNRDGELVTLKENQDYMVKHGEREGQWKENHYILPADNFAQEGNYSVVFHSRDRANNQMNNTSVKKKAKNLPIEFTVDKSAPTVVVSGIKDGGQYRLSRKNITIDAKDNLALARVTVSIDGRETVYNAEELRAVNGMIEMTVSGANTWQEIKVTSEDQAGNQLGQTKEGDQAQPVIMKILVTPNGMVQYYRNKPLFYGSVAVTVLMVGLLVFFIWRKRTRDCHPLK